jgi:sugar O-acyltransferase (sialic acid O-acetyltransferase NeuD family)
LPAEIKQIMIYGASGHGFAMAQAITAGFAPDRLCAIAGFIDDVKGGAGLDMGSFPILSFDQWRTDHRDKPCLIAIGEPASRALLSERIAQAGGTFCDLYSDRPAHLFPYVSIGQGVYVDRMAYIGPSTTIGAHAHVMPMSSIGHDVVIGEYSTICPSCTISGYVVIERGVFLGAGTTIVNGRSDSPLVIGANARTWAGSVVTRSVRPGARVAGNPARELREAVKLRRSGG